MSAVLQDDYGGFSPRFPGVTVRLHDRAAFDTLDRFIRDDLPPADGADFNAIAIRSVLDHEIRHYHDFLLSSYGSTLYRSKLQAVIAGDVLFHLLRGLPGRWLPVPLGRWAGLDADERAVHVAEWQEAIGTDALDIVPLPSLAGKTPARAFGPFKVDYDEEGAARLLDAARLAYDKVRQLTRGTIRLADASELMPCNFFEVLGLAAQVQAIHRAQSPAAAARFLEFLGDSALPYARLWRRMISLAAGLPAVAERGLLDRASLMALWCILGSYDADGTAACPNARFLMLEKIVAANPPGADVAEAWDRWDAAAGTAPWRNGLHAMRSSNRKQSAQYRKLAGKGPLYDIVADIFEAYVGDQTTAVDLLLARPADLAVMNRYLALDAAISPLPVPLTRIDLVGFGLAAAENGAFHPLWGSGPDEVASQFVLNTGDPGFRKRINDAAVLERMMRVTDLAFANAEPSLSFDPVVAGDIAVMTGKRPLWIM